MNTNVTSPPPVSIEMSQEPNYPKVINTGFGSLQRKIRKPDLLKLFSLRCLFPKCLPLGVMSSNRLFGSHRQGGNPIRSLTTPQAHFQIPVPTRRQNLIREGQNNLLEGTKWAQSTQGLKRCKPQRAGDTSAMVVTSQGGSAGHTDLGKQHSALKLTCQLN